MEGGIGMSEYTTVFGSLAHGTRKAESKSFRTRLGIMPFPMSLKWPLAHSRMKK